MYACRRTTSGINGLARKRHVLASDPDARVQSSLSRLLSRAISRYRRARGCVGDSRILLSQTSRRYVRRYDAFYVSLEISSIIPFTRNLYSRTICPSFSLTSFSLIFFYLFIYSFFPSLSLPMRDRTYIRCKKKKKKINKQHSSSSSSSSSRRYCVGASVRTFRDEFRNVSMNRRGKR